jgi:hypothetical protein
MLFFDRHINSRYWGHFLFILKMSSYVSSFIWFIWRTTSHVPTGVLPRADRTLWRLRNHGQQWCPIFFEGELLRRARNRVSIFWSLKKKAADPFFFLSRPNIWIKKRVGRAQPNGHKKIEQAAIFSKTQLPLPSPTKFKFSVQHLVPHVFLPTSRNFQIKANHQQWRIQLDLFNMIVIATVIVPTQFTATSLLSRLEQVQWPCTIV